MQRALDRAHRAIFDPQCLSTETKLVFILYRLRHVLLPEGEMGKPHNLATPQTCNCRALTLSSYTYSSASMKANISFPLVEAFPASIGARAPGW